MRSPARTPACSAGLPVITRTISSSPALRLQLHAQADEIAFDLRVDLAELVGGEVGRVGIQAIGRPAEVFEDRRGGLHFEALLGQRRQGRHGVDGVLTGRDGCAAASELPRIRRRKGSMAAQSRGGNVLLPEGRLAQRHIEIGGRRERPIRASSGSST